MGPMEPAFFHVNGAFLLVVLGIVAKRYNTVAVVISAIQEGS